MKRSDDKSFERSSNLLYFQIKMGGCKRNEIPHQFYKLMAFSSNYHQIINVPRYRRLLMQI